MSVSPYSTVMAMLWFTLASLIGCFVLRRAEKWGLALIGMVFLLTTIRIFMPLDITGSIIIRSQLVYPAVQGFMRHPIVGSVTVGGCLLLLWIAGAGFQFLGLVREWVQQRKFRDEAELVEEDEWLCPLFVKVAEEFGYHGPFRLAVTEKVSSAYQTGFLHPYILLPAQIDRFRDEDICNMLRHELCHFRSGDLWAKLWFQGIKGILWWNPVMPLLSRSVEQLLELRCDRKVCKHLSKEKQMSYMATLIELVKCSSMDISQVYVGCLGSDHDEDMMQRFRMALLGEPSLSGRIRQAACCTLCVLLFAASYHVAFQPWVLPPFDEQSETEFLETELTEASCYIRYTLYHELELYCDNSFYCTISQYTLNSVPFRKLPVVFDPEGSEPAVSEPSFCLAATSAQEEDYALFPAEEITWCAQKRYGALQVRLWSNTRGMWLTDWKSYCSSKGDIYPIPAYQFL